MSQHLGAGTSGFATASGIPIKPVYTAEDVAGAGSYTGKTLPDGAPEGFITVSGYEIREAGATAVEELAFVVGRAIGQRTEAPGKPFCFRFSVQSDFFEEAAKLRAARGLWNRLLAERFPADGLAAVRVEARISARMLSPDQPYENVIRVTLATLAATLGQADSVDTSPLGEAGGLPERRSEALAARILQVIEHESGVAAGPDPFGGGYYIECLTGELGNRALDLIRRGEC